MDRPAGTGVIANVQSRVDWTEAGSLCCVVYPSAFLTSCHHYMFVSILHPSTVLPASSFCIAYFTSFCYASPAIQGFFSNLVVVNTPSLFSLLFFLANFILRVQLSPRCQCWLVSAAICAVSCQPILASRCHQHSRSPVRVNWGKLFVIETSEFLRRRLWTLESSGFLPRVVWYHSADYKVSHPSSRSKGFNDFHYQTAWNNSH